MDTLGGQSVPFSGLDNLNLNTFQFKIISFFFEFLKQF